MFKNILIAAILVSPSVVFAQTSSTHGFISRSLGDGLCEMERLEMMGVTEGRIYSKWSFGYRSPTFGSVDLSDIMPGETYMMTFDDAAQEDGLFWCQEMYERLLDGRLLGDFDTDTGGPFGGGGDDNSNDGGMTGR